MASPAIDYDALAKQSGAIQSKPAEVDYDALAAQSGAMQPENQPSQNRDGASAFLSGVKSGSSLISALSHPIDTFKSLSGYDDAKAAYDSWKQGNKKTAAANALKFIASSPATRMAQGMVSTGADQFSRAKDAFNKGDYEGAITHASAVAAPLIAGAANGADQMRTAGKRISTDPQYQSFGDRMNAFANDPDAIEGAGQITGNALDFALPKAIEPLVPKAVALGKAIRSPLKTADAYQITQTSPVDAMVQAVKPRASVPKFRESLERAMPSIKSAAAEIGRPIGSLDGTPDYYPGSSVQDALQATRLAKRNAWNGYQSIKGPASAAGWTVDLTPAADAADQVIPESLVQRAIKGDPGAVDELQAARAQNNWLRSQFDVDSVEKLLQEHNAKLDSYYDENPSARRGTELSNPKIAREAAIANALRSALYDRLDDFSTEENGAARAFKKRYGDLSKVEEALSRRLNVTMRQAPNSLAEQVGKAQGYADVAKGGLKTLGGIASGHPGVALSGLGDIFSGMTEREVSKFLKNSNHTDTLIRRAFAAHDTPETPINVPPPPIPKGYLESGPVQMGSVQDDSGPVNSAPAITIHPGWTTPGQGAVKQLPHGGTTRVYPMGPGDLGGAAQNWQDLSQDTTGKIAPTVPRGGRVTIPESRRLGGATPGQPKPLVTPKPKDTSGATITNAMPVVDPETGEILYYTSESQTPTKRFVTVPGKMPPPQ